MNLNVILRKEMREDMFYSMNLLKSVNNQYII